MHLLPISHIQKIGQYLRQLSAKQEVALLCFSCCIIFNYLQVDFKIVFICALLLFVILAFKLRSIFLALYILFFVTNLFLTPGKFYSFTVIPPGKVLIEPFYSQGVLDGYGFISADFVAVALIFYFVRKEFDRAKKNPYQLSQVVRQNPFLITITLSLCCFFLSGLYSAFFTSLFSTFSLVNLFQYMKIVVFIFSTILLLKSTTKGKSHLEQILLGGYFFNAYLSIQQFLGGLTTVFHSTVNPDNLTQADNQSIIPRIQGSFLHPNEFGFFMVVWFLLLVHLNQKKYLHIKWLVPFFLEIAISQSRTVWIGMLLCICLFQSKNVFIFLQFLWTRKFSLFKKYWSILFITLVLGLFVVVPRVMGLRYTLDGGSGAIRVQMISEGWQILQNSPLFGYGANTNIMLMYQQIPLGSVSHFPYPVHMGYLQLALEVGLLGAFFFFFPLCFLLFHTVKTQNDRQIWLLSAILTTTLIYYMLQPHGGRLEIPLLGIPIGYICLILNQAKSKKIFSKK